MYPPVGIGQIRVASQDVMLGENLFIPKGVIVIVPHFAMHNVSHNWSNPSEFDPGLSPCLDSSLGMLTGLTRCVSRTSG